MAKDPQPRERRKIERFSRLGVLGRRYYFRARGKNGEPLGTSEGYNSAAARDNGIEAAREVYAVGKIVDV